MEILEEDYQEILNFVSERNKKQRGPDRYIHKKIHVAKMEIDQPQHGVSKRDSRHDAPPDTADGPGTEGSLPNPGVDSFDFAGHVARRAVGVNDVENPVRNRVRRDALVVHQ